METVGDRTRGEAKGQCRTKMDPTMRRGRYSCEADHTKARSYFLAYEWLVQKHIRDKGVKRDEISPVWAVTYGGAAGFALWFT